MLTSVAHGRRAPAALRRRGRRRARAARSRPAGIRSRGSYWVVSSGLATRSQTSWVSRGGRCGNDLITSNVPARLPTAMWMSIVVCWVCAVDRVEAAGAIELDRAVGERLDHRVGRGVARLAHRLGPQHQAAIAVLAVLADVLVLAAVRLNFSTNALAASVGRSSTNEVAITMPSRSSSESCVFSRPTP